MRNRFLLFGALAGMLILNACAPFVIAEASGEQPAPEIVTVPATGYQPVDVDQVTVEVGVGSPIPVLVTATGRLPDSCSQIELVRQKQSGSHFEIRLSTIPSSAEGCLPLTERSSGVNSRGPLK